MLKQVYTWMAQKTEKPTRRHVLQALVFGFLALFLWPFKRAYAKKVGFLVTKVAELQQVGGAKLLTIKNRPILVIRDGENSVHALNPECTHKKCQVLYKKELNSLACKCHKSSFKLDGTVVSGPAPKPLTTYPAILDGEQIVITLPD